MTIDHPIQLLELFALDNDNRLAFAPVQLIDNTSEGHDIITSSPRCTVGIALGKQQKKRTENWT